MSQQFEKIKSSGSGYAFVNKKSKETQPDFRGKVIVCGKEHSVVGWWKESKDKERFISLQFTDINDLPPKLQPAKNVNINSTEVKDPPKPGSDPLADIFG